MTVLGAMYDFKVKGILEPTQYILLNQKCMGLKRWLACEIFDTVETVLNLPANTAKIGIMDEERRTTVNLKECIRQLKVGWLSLTRGFLIEREMKFIHL